jgi:hypothetical protein
MRGFLRRTLSLRSAVSCAAHCKVPFRGMCRAGVGYFARQCSCRNALRLGMLAVRLAGWQAGRLAGCRQGACVGRSRAFGQCVFHPEAYNDKDGSGRLPGPSGKIQGTDSSGAPRMPYVRSVDDPTGQRCRSRQPVANNQPIGNSGDGNGGAIHDLAG